MVSIAEKIKNEIPNMNERIIDTDIFLEDLDIPRAKKNAALRELSRLEKNNTLTRLAKGIYAKSEVSSLTNKNKPISDKEIIRYYTKDNKGLTAGYDLYNRKNVSTQVSKTKTILSNRLKKEERTVKMITVKHTDIEMNDQVQGYIEILEIVENSNIIQDFNKQGFYQLMLNFSEIYNSHIMNYVLENLNYKKRTISNIHKILGLLGIDSGLEKHLNTTSRYKENVAYEAISSRR